MIVMVSASKDKKKETTAMNRTQSIQRREKKIVKMFNYNYSNKYLIVFFYEF